MLGVQTFKRESEMGFEEAFSRLIVNEGGLSNVSGDAGGLTKYGISQRSYPDLDIGNLTIVEAKAIYLRDYWQRGGMDRYDSGLAFQVFDCSVNSGIGTAIRLLQRAVGVVEDGVVGPMTLAAIQSRSVCEVIMRFSAERLLFLVKLSGWNDFGRGWARRVANNMLEAK